MAPPAGVIRVIHLRGCVKQHAAMRESMFRASAATKSLGHVSSEFRAGLVSCAPAGLMLKFGLGPTWLVAIWGVLMMMRSAWLFTTASVVFAVAFGCGGDTQEQGDVDAGSGGMGGTVTGGAA